MSTEIEFGQDDRLGTRLWRVQRVAWGLMAGAIGAALLGAFGGAGYYATTKATSGDLQVRYDRFPRRASRMAYELIVRNPGSEPAIALSASLVEALRIEAIIPEPRTVTRSDTDLILTFEPPMSGALRVSLRGTADALGPRSGAIRFGDWNVRASQFFYP